MYTPLVNVFTFLLTCLDNKCIHQSGSRVSDVMSGFRWVFLKYVHAMPPWKADGVWDLFKGSGQKAWDRRSAHWGFFTRGDRGEEDNQRWANIKSCICIFDFFVTEQTRRKLIKGLFAILFVCLPFSCLFVGCLVCCLFVLLKHFNDGEVDQV